MRKAKTKENLMSVTDYAELCEVSNTVILKRIKQGEISAQKIEGCYFIDAGINKPKGAKKAGRPSSDKILQSL